MRFLADMGVARTTVLALRELGHEVEHILETGPHDLPDAAILARARDGRMVVVTFDLDFGDLLAAAGESLPSVVMIRLTDQRPASATPKLVAAVRRFHGELEAGALVVVENSRCRLRRLPLK